jgi:hypothetical protein
MALSWPHWNFIELAATNFIKILLLGTRGSKELPEGRALGALSFLQGPRSRGARRSQEEPRRSQEDVLL